jgi:hypothetical protein
MLHICTYIRRLYTRQPTTNNVGIKCNIYEQTIYSFFLLPFYSNWKYSKTFTVRSYTPHTLISRSVESTLLFSSSIHHAPVSIGALILEMMLAAGDRACLTKRNPESTCAFGPIIVCSVRCPLRCLICRPRGQFVSGNGFWTMANVIVA